MNRLKPSDVSAFVLAGGQGTRLRPVTGDHPKVMARIGGRPFIEIILGQVRHAGVRHVVLCTGYRAAEIRDAVGASHDGMTVEYAEEPIPLGTGGALRFALPKARSGTILVLNGDSFCAADLPAFLDRHVQTGAPASIVLKHARDTARFGRVETSPEGRVLAFREKRAGEGSINAGIYLFHEQLLAGIPEDTFVSLENTVIPGWLDQGIPITAYLCKDIFFDIGTPASFAEADAYFSKRIPETTGTLE
ncbi:MAG TPA: nucleotidyltransferase family protein [Candidatus Deferrimicrobiaceae bacterium]|jgi:NDP-sugar pyrophosphorylase family protein